MDPYQIMLIQGSPGTGKTTTIINMIEFLVTKRKAKIHVCAPSASAVEEIVLRLKPGTFIRIDALNEKEVSLDEKKKLKEKKRAL